MTLFCDDFYCIKFRIWSIAHFAHGSSLRDVLGSSQIVDFYRQSQGPVDFWDQLWFAVTTVQLCSESNNDTSSAACVVEIM